MVRTFLTVAVLLVCGTALAQESQTPLEQALMQRLNAEVGGGIQCGAAYITLQRELTAAQQKIKTMEEKYEPKSK